VECYRLESAWLVSEFGFMEQERRGAEATKGTCVWGKRYDLAKSRDGGLSSSLWRCARSSHISQGAS